MTAFDIEVGVSFNRVFYYVVFFIAQFRKSF